MIPTAAPSRNWTEVQVQSPVMRNREKSEKLSAAFRSASAIRRCKTKSGKRKAILRWCQKMKEVLQ